jgi:hypothetical protein
MHVIALSVYAPMHYLVDEFDQRDRMYLRILRNSAFIKICQLPAAFPTESSTGSEEIFIE